ncbi:hypothetical protein AAHA92_24710 [Salvia divinorum]|uniref:Uncharacterized protein n=1 Tax=Salvia divinorum TaxID=28513 RepID=A0ABD1G891_SALDI
MVLTNFTGGGVGFGELLHSFYYKQTLCNFLMILNWLQVSELAGDSEVVAVVSGWGLDGDLARLMAVGRVQYTKQWDNRSRDDRVSEVEEATEINTTKNGTAAAAPKIQWYNKPCQLQHGETKLGRGTASGVARIMNASVSSVWQR